MFNNWYPYGFATPNTFFGNTYNTPTWTPTWNTGFGHGMPTGIPTGFPTGSFGPWNSNPWTNSYTAFFNSFFEALTIWQWNFINSIIAVQSGAMPTFPGFGIPNPNVNPNVRNGWTTPTGDFAGMGFANRNA